MHAATARNREGEISRAVADFYDRLVFPSQTSHPFYLSLAPATHGELVADFGCGQSLWYDALRAHAPPPVFVDISSNALRTLDYGHRIQADLLALPLVDACFDRILCVGVLHHLPHPAGALLEIARVLKRRGRCFLGVYAPESFPARLKCLYDAFGGRTWQGLVFGLTMGLILLRYFVSGRVLDAADARKRAIDLLKVPYVRRASLEYWSAEARAAGLQQAALHRVSSMNVIELVRT